MKKPTPATKQTFRWKRLVGGEREIGYRRAVYAPEAGAVDLSEGSATSLIERVGGGISLLNVRGVVRHCGSEKRRGGGALGSERNLISSARKAQSEVYERA